jgi:hypothetical protein
MEQWSKVTKAPRSAASDTQAAGAAPGEPPTPVIPATFISPCADWFLKESFTKPQIWLLPADSNAENLSQNCNT